jgi:spore coat polysaccharide biosynthesis protein SpsF
MKTVAIIQTRMGSTRLPGKVLLDIGGRSMLARVIRRVRRAHTLDEVVVATTICSRDDAIIQECQRLKIPVFRGSEDDVLDRYYCAANEHYAEVIVRITSDCPMIDPDVIDHVVLTFFRKKPDYASNGLSRTYPRGLDTEVMSLDALKKAWKHATLPYQRAHVTPYIHTNPKIFRLESVSCDVKASHYRWTVDTQEDLALVRELYSRLGNNDDFSWRDAFSLMIRDPGLTIINRHVEHKSMEEG